MTLFDFQSEAETLFLPHFDEAAALQLGLWLVEQGQQMQLPIVINIRTANRTLFHAALAGSAANNENWARRKSNAALIFAEASLQIGTRNREKAETLAKHGLSEADHADHGGAVPICVAGTGMVAVATVSGLPQVEDHALVVRAIRALQADMAGQ